MRGLSTCCHLDLALGLISALPRADPLTEEEVLLLFSNTREQQPTPPHTHTPPPQLRPVGKTTKLEVVEGRRGQEGAGGWVQTETPSPRPAPSKISTSNQALTFTEWGS